MYLETCRSQEPRDWVFKQQSRWTDGARAGRGVYPSRFSDGCDWQHQGRGKKNRVILQWVTPPRTFSVPGLDPLAQLSTWPFGAVWGLFGYLDRNCTYELFNYSEHASLDPAKVA